MPYSGPVTAFGTLGKGEIAYFNMINDQGGVNGRKIKLISLDDGYAPPKTVEQTRKLVEQDEVALIFSTIGTATNTAIAKYLNDRKIPQLFIGSGASKWGDYKEHPWTMRGVQATFRSEARIYTKYILEKNPNARIAILYQNDDFGRDYMNGVRDVLGDRYAAVVKEATYEFTDPTIDSQIVSLQGSGADALIVAATPKFAAQAIRRVYDIGWKPMFFSQQRSDLGIDRDGAGRRREGHRHHLVRLCEGPDRSRLERRSGDEGVEGVHAEIPEGWRHPRPELCQLLQLGDGAGAGAEAVRQ